MSLHRSHGGDDRGTVPGQVESVDAECGLLADADPGVGEEEDEEAAGDRTDSGYERAVESDVYCARHARGATPIEAVRSLVRTVIEHAPAEVRPPLLMQAEALEYISGPVTMMQLRVTGDCPPADGVTNPVPGGPSVVDAEGNDIGLLLLRLDDAGYIDCLE